MSDLDDFMAKNKPTCRLKLKPYLNDISILIEHGYSETDILRYLYEKKRIKVTIRTLSSFIVRYIKNEPEHRNGKYQEKVKAEVVKSESLSDGQSETQVSQTRSKPKPQLKNGIKKFDWKNATTEGLI